MSIWYRLIGLFFLFVLIEEAIYYSWNRYLYGKDFGRRQKWKTRLLLVFSFFKRKEHIVIEHSEYEEKSSS
ncbi:hypothetical protein [Bacillus sp. USDA818B3_A]|uniref:hypothetical protein n=1 Tax=Bacillus sp. USDA818B3_A TaxID=2698834 RepID=UPI0013712936|nr:hypothetical protein [Bacillus sp. USDA818B3_A]